MTATGTAEYESATRGTVAIAGRVVSEVLEDSEGVSPIGLVARGTIEGSLNGTFEFVGQRLVPTDAPDVFFLTGTAVIHDRDGDLATLDSVAVNAAEGGGGELVGLCQLTGLTGRWAGASGYLQSVGHFTLGAGGAERYVGSIVLAG